MSWNEPGRFEPEFDGPLPRQVELTPAGIRELAISLLPTLACVVLGAWTFFATPLLGRSWIGALLFGVFFVLGFYLVMRVLSVWERRFEIIRYGTPNLAVVVEKKREMTGLERYTAWYTAAGRQWSAEAVSLPRSAEIGDAVTVLCLPGEAGKSLLYPFAGCAAREAHDAVEGLPQSPSLSGR